VNRVALIVATIVLVLATAATARVTGMACTHKAAVRAITLPRLPV
jgi:hypothetical protein